MKIKRLSSLLSIAVIVSLMLSLLNTVNVFADDETPSAPATEEPAQSSEENTASETDSEPVVESEPLDSESIPETDTAATPEPTDDSVSTDETGSDDAAQAEEPAVAEPETTVAEALDQAPEGTKIVVVNAEGESEPLATEEAEAIIATADPIWCKDGVTPDPTDPDCSPSFGSMTDLITWLTTNDPNFPGKIWIQDSYDSGSNVTDTGLNFTLDGSTLTNMANNSLIIQGGWSGVVDDINITGSSEFNGYLHVVNWGANVTLNDIVVDGATGIGINVTTTGNINLEDVTSSNNTGGEGAKLNITIGSGVITLTGTNTFNGNNDIGLRVNSSGDITLNDITANKNNGIGVFLLNTSGSGVITLTGTNTFNENKSQGLLALSNGDITLNNITANKNGNNGAYLGSDNGMITLTGTNTFNGNDDHGLVALSKGDITLNNITANENGNNGAYLLNKYGSGVITLTGTNTFNGNGLSGLNAYSNGDITVNNITANENYGNGVVIDNTTGTGDVFVNGANQFNNNVIGYGLTVLSLGDITVENVTANNNFDNGAYLSNCGGGGGSCDGSGTGDVYVNGTNQFNNNPFMGLRIYSDGNIEINNVTATFNSTGVYLHNSMGTDQITVNGGTYCYNSTNDLGLFSSGTLIVNGPYFADTTSFFTFAGIAGSSIDDPDPCPPLPVAASGGNNETYAGLPIREIFTSGGSAVLDCDLYRGTKLILPNDDFAYFPCPLRDSASINPLGSSSLPGDLPDGNNFLSAFNTTLTQDGESKATVSPAGAVSFTIPDGTDVSSLAILFWDGGNWVEQSGFVNDGNFQANVNVAGDFVLVSK